MNWLFELPIWVIFLAGFLSRVVDVSLGTIRTISVVNGRLTLSVVLGFFEVILWGVAVAQVVTQLRDHPILLLAYAGGFAVGNAVGITLEKTMALGMCMLRMISSSKSEEIVDRLRGMGHGVTTFLGSGRNGPRTLIYTLCKRKELSGKNTGRTPTPN